MVVSNYKLEKILNKWAKEAKAYQPISYKYDSGTLYIYTSQPGYLIGKAGSLSGKYRTIITETFEALDFVKVIEVHTLNDRSATFREFSGGENLENLD